MGFFNAALYAPLSAAANPGVDAAAAVTPPTATAAPTAQEYLAQRPSIDDWDAYSKWAQNAPTAGWTAADYGLWNTQGPMQGVSPNATWEGLLSQMGTPEGGWSGSGEAAQFSAAGPTREGILYGGVGYAKDAIDQTLQQIAAAAQMPAEFNWDRYMQLAARQQYDQTHALPGASTSNPISLVYSSLRNAIAEHPELAPYLDIVAPGGELWAKGEEARLAQAAREDAANTNYYSGLLSVLSGPFAAWAGPAINSAIGAIGGGGAAAAAATAAEEAAQLGGYGALPSAAANPGMLATALGAGATSGLSAAVQGLDPLRGFATGALTSGLSSYAEPMLQSVFDSFSPDINFATAAEDTRRATEGMLGGSPEMPSLFGTESGFMPAVDTAAADPALLQQLAGRTPSYSTMAQTTTDPFTEVSYSTPAMTTFTGEGMLPMSVPTMGLPLDIGAQLAGGLTTSGLTAPDLAAPDLAAPEAAPKEPSAADRITRLAKIGASLAKMAGGQGTPEDAPQRADGQSDADYAQSLASYVNVDAQALADMGLVPGTPEYYDYLMTQLDATVENLTGGLNVESADLEQQLRGKTREELDSLRRVLFVRGQLDQLMGSGTYTDPFTGRSENVITNGRQVNPGVAAYHRGLGRSIEDFSRMTPIERKQAIGDFLDRSPDLYGMQERSDARDAQAEQAQAYLEDLKRRRSGMFGGTGMGQVSDAELAALFGQR